MNPLKWRVTRTAHLGERYGERSESFGLLRHLPEARDRHSEFTFWLTGPLLKLDPSDHEEFPATLFDVPLNGRVETIDGIVPLRHFLRFRLPVPAFAESAGTAYCWLIV